MSNLTAKDVINLLTSRAVADALGIQTNVMTLYKRKGKLPASWYFTIKRMCAEKGVEVPDSLFNMKGVHNDSD